MRLSLGRRESLTISLAELDRLLTADREVRREAFEPAALICSVIANVNRNSDVRPEPFTPADFIPATERELEEQEEAANRPPTPEEVENYKQRLKLNFNKPS